MMVSHKEICIKYDVKYQLADEQLYRQIISLTKFNLTETTVSKECIQLYRQEADHISNWSELLLLMLLVDWFYVVCYWLTNCLLQESAVKMQPANHSKWQAPFFNQ